MLNKAVKVDKVQVLPDNLRSSSLDTSSNVGAVRAVGGYCFLVGAVGGYCF